MTRKGEKGGLKEWGHPVENKNLCKEFEISLPLCPYCQQLSKQI